jgi:hypothetical protein
VPGGKNGLERLYGACTLGFLEQDPCCDERLYGACTLGFLEQDPRCDERLGGRRFISQETRGYRAVRDGRPMYLSCAERSSWVLELCATMVHVYRRRMYPITRQITHQITRQIACQGRVIRYACTRVQRMCSHIEQVVRMRLQWLCIFASVAAVYTRGSSNAMSVIRVRSTWSMSSASGRARVLGAA